METIKNIYCVGRNYVEHVHELGNMVPDQPVIFSKPTHALVKANHRTIQLPNDQGDIHYEAELVLKVGEDYQPDCSIDDVISEMTIGLDLTLRDVQNGLKEKAHPWLLSKGFKNSAVFGRFIPFPGIDECKKMKYFLYINNKKRQTGDISKMIFPIETLVHFIGKNLGLKKDDIIYTGTPEGVGPLQDGDEITMYWDEEVLGESKIQI